VTLLAVLGVLFSIFVTAALVYVLLGLLHKHYLMVV
jgi:hypothetical protein